MKNLLKRIDVELKHLKYPENVWYGGGLKRATALNSVGKGWASLIDNLYDAMPKGTKVVQVKEKFGGLRFYIASGPEWYYDLIDHYENESYTKCEKCGAIGKLREDLGWILTLCEQHYQEKLMELETRQKTLQKGVTNE